MKRIAQRLADLERHSAPGTLIVVDPGETEAMAMTGYESAHGPINGPAMFICTGVPRKDVA
ncbi:MAG: hypothetical protein KDE63_11750 [Novosphingobium sp.]|nr:hypothetical protein [Caldilineaceae bacterium]MCB2052090.1 hypothetical protein [Novosphingobium sp.]MCP5380325.1 hypothetical protein [Novosphingobium sp.]